MGEKKGQKMKVLVLNCGSSTLKYHLINMDEKSVMAKGNYERIGEQEAFLTHKVSKEKYVINHITKILIALKCFCNSCELSIL